MNRNLSNGSFGRIRRVSSRADSTGDGGAAGSDDHEKMPLHDDYDDDFDDEDLVCGLMETGAPAPPDGGWGWVIVFASFMCNLIVDGIAYTFGVFIDDFANDFRDSNGEIVKGNVAWVGSLLSGVYLFVGPVVSALTNKFGCRIVCIAGSIIACIGFALSSMSQSLPVMMLTYGVIGGIGFGMIYLPAVVCVGYYFESKRALATGLAVCGSGVGTFLFSPFASWLLTQMDWRQANLLLAGLIFCCGLFGALMKPLEITRVEYDEEDYDGIDPENGDVKNGRREKPLLQRMAEEKRNYLEKGSMAGSQYFMVQLPDGTKEMRMKLPINVDPGVHSSFNLDQIAPGTPITPVPTLATLPTISETDQKNLTAMDNNSVNIISLEPPTPEDELVISIPEPIAEEEEENSSGTKTDDEEPNISSSVTKPVPIGSARKDSDVMNSNGTTTSSGSIKGSDQGQPSSPTKAAGPTPIRVGSMITPSSVRGMPRNGSAPQFNSARSIPKNGSVPAFDRMVRRQSYRAVPLGTSIKENASLEVPGNGPRRNTSKPNLQDANRRGSSNFRTSASFVSTRNSIGMQDDDYSSLWSKGELTDGLVFSSSRKDSTDTYNPPPRIIRPMSRKDIFYAGSIVNLPEFQSQRSIASYRQSVLNLPKAVSGSIAGSYMPGMQGQGFMIADEVDAKQRTCCPCLNTGPFKTALAEMMDFSLLKNPVFLLIAISNVFGMLGFYVPFVYIIDSAVSKQVADKQTAANLLAIIGVTNTIGRVAIGMISDLPKVNSLFMNNMCILLSGLCVIAVPFCESFMAYIIVAIFFGLFVSGYVSLTSIILVELLGLENLTNAFGLLILFRGAASIVGSPLAGAVFDLVGNYSTPFLMAGGFLVISAALSFMVPFVSRCAPEKPILEPRYTPGAVLPDIPEDEDEQVSGNTSTNQSVGGGDQEKQKSVIDNVESCL